MMDETLLVDSSTSNNRAKRTVYYALDIAFAALVLLFVIVKVTKTANHQRHLYATVYGLGTIQLEQGDDIPFSYFWAGDVVRIVVVDDVLKYYQGSGGHSVGQDGGGECYDKKYAKDAKTICFHGEADRSASENEIKEEDGSVSYEVVFDKVIQYSIQVFPSNATFVMTINGETYSSDNGNVFLVTSLNDYSVEQIFVDFSSISLRQIDDGGEIVAEKLQEISAVYEFAQAAIEENANWDNEDENWNKNGDEN